MAAEDNRLRIPEGLHTPVLDQHRLRMSEDVRILLKLTRVKDPGAQRLATRALGRYESREFITDLVPLLVVEDVRDTAARAIVQAFRGPVHPADRDGQQARGVMDVINTHATKDATYVETAADAIAQLPYERADHADAAQRMLREFLRRAEANTSLPLSEVVRSIDLFARRHRKLSPLDDELVERLREIAVAAKPRHQAASRWATAALVTAGALDIVTLRSTAVDSRGPEKRRLSAIVLGGTSLEVDHAERVHFLKKLLRDEQVQVRIEAVRAWARRATPVEGCELLLESLKDPNPHVVLTTIDALGDACPTDMNLTDRLTAEIKTPPVRGWHRAAHALLALAKRAPDRVSIALNSAIVSHPVWEVRMYGARVAAMLKDATALERLAMDRHDNVREAALPALRALKGSESDHIFVAALGRRDYQLLLTAANTLEGAPPPPELSGALLSALLRVTAEKRDTSRDTRLALIARLGELGTQDQAEHIAPLLRDFDITVAVAALELYERWQGPSANLFAPTPLPRPALPSSGELSDDEDAVVEMESGRKFGIRLFPGDAPLTVTRFRRLAATGYYEGLTFHRVVPNFVVQGGSPGANEYAGDAQFMRDEIGRPHTAFTVGLSTRGRDTGDAQFFINLIDNRRLDPDYTVFGEVCDIIRAGAAGRAAVESIVEGDRISTITLEKYDPCRR